MKLTQKPKRKNKEYTTPRKTTNAGASITRQQKETTRKTNHTINVGVDALIDPIAENTYKNIANKQIRNKTVGAGPVSARNRITPRTNHKTNVGERCYATQNGITLIALVITIIILLILVGVTINIMLGENGLFSTAKKASENYINAQEQELALLNELPNTITDITGSGTNTDKTNKIKVNAPKITGTGLTPVTIGEDGSLTEVSSNNSNWYNYVDTSVSGQKNTSKWANAKTQDGSLWVWIPRYAYKITYTDASDKSKGGTIDIVFLNGTTNNDFNGNDVTIESYVDENGNTGAYIVHPAFQDGTSNNFANGEWDAEITGFWVAKFEAGYEGTAGDATTAQDSTVALSVIMQWNVTSAENLTTNYYGERDIGDKIKYPVFKANCPSMNNLGISDAYDLVQSLTAEGNPYGFSSDVDSHLTKNSEWGAVAYLTHSKYGRNGEEVTINNVSVNGTSTIYAVTGYAGATVNTGPDTTRTLEILLKDNQAGSWTTKQGQTASSTGNIYGIYDLSGGLWEWTAGYIASGTNYTTYGGSLKGESTKYKSKYAGTSSTDTINYLDTANATRLGEAIWETSASGADSTSWNSNYSQFLQTSSQFSIRGGRWDDVSRSGGFAFLRIGGYCFSGVGFRSVLVP